MKENVVDIEAMPEAKAAKLNAENKYRPWPVGLYVVIDDARAVLETRQEAEALAAQIIAEANKLWPAQT